MKLYIDGSSLTLNDFISAVYDKNAELILTEDSKAAINRSREVIDNWVEKGEVIYGVTTGFGEFSNVSIPREQIETLQENLIISHAAGIGNFLPEDVVRGMLILRVNAVSKGYSGIRLSTVETLIKMFNAGIIPAVPEQGSVGSSGDLAPLSHIALALIGRGWCLVDGKEVPSAEVLKAHGIEPVRLAAKEGLALINGTQMMTSFGAIAVHKALRLANVADISGALAWDALRGTEKAYDERIHLLRGFKGQIEVAKNLRELTAGSEIRESHRTGDGKVQDPYSLRCMPQIHGASRDTINYVASVVSTELNSANDNPLIFPDTLDHIEGGNFHGQPIALALDFLAIACAELANVAERRTERLVNGSLSGLPRFLTKNGGVQSGLMIAQYASAAIVSENKVLCHPASVDSIPTSANQEDHNSMGSISSRKCFTVVNNLQKVLAVELLCSSQGIGFLRPLKSSVRLEKVIDAIRTKVPFAETDRIVHCDMKAIVELIEDGSIEKAAGF